MAATIERLSTENRGPPPLGDHRVFQKNYPPTDGQQCTKRVYVRLELRDEQIFLWAYYNEDLRAYENRCSIPQTSTTDNL